jgi:hypothetical protein
MSNVKKKHNYFGVVEVVDDPLDVLKIVVDTPALDEGTLTMGDQAAEVWCEAVGQDLSE